MQVGKAGDVGIVEITSMMVTVKGPTAGAVTIEWNVAGSSLGAAGIWGTMRSNHPSFQIPSLVLTVAFTDTHVRIGGAAGSDLSAENCPKQSGIVNPRCKAASLLMHLKPKSTAYLENVWLWTADHEVAARRYLSLWRSIPRWGRRSRDVVGGWWMGMHIVRCRLWFETSFKGVAEK